jgi:hypothetical protein
MALKLIREDIAPSDLEILSEGENSERTFKIKGIFIQAEKLNGNRRIYPLDICEREVSKYIKEEVSRKNALGEYQHPASPIVNRERACILIESLVQDGNNFVGTAKVLQNFPMGRLVYNLLKEGIPTGVSTRGLGTVNESNRRVNPDFSMRAVDVVDTPSAPEAWVDGILEGKEFIIQGDLIVEQAVTILKKGLDKNGSKQLVNQLKEFIRRIK